MTLVKNIRSFSIALAAICIALTSASSLNADVVLQNWQFDDANGTTLNNAVNTGTLGTAFNFGGPRTQNGVLNIGDTPFFKWETSNGQVFRAADFADLTTGEYVFEYVIADWNLGGTDGVGITNNGIKFNVGDKDTGIMSMEFEVSQTDTDIRVRSQNSSNGTLTGTDAQHQLGGNDVNTSFGAVVVQLNANLDTGIWSTRTAGADGIWQDLVTNGTGMNSIDRIQLAIDGSNGAGWEYGGIGGTATEYVTIDSVTLTQVVNVPEPTSMAILGLVSIGLVARRRRA